MPIFCYLKSTVAQHVKTAAFIEIFHQNPQKIAVGLPSLFPLFVLFICG